MWNFVASIQQTLDEAAGLNSAQPTTSETRDNNTLDTSPEVTGGILENPEQEEDDSRLGSSESSETDESSLPHMESQIHEEAHNRSNDEEHDNSESAKDLRSPHVTPPPPQQQLLADRVDVANGDDDDKCGTSSSSSHDAPAPAAAVPTPSPPQPSNRGHSATSSSSHPLPSSDAAASA
ncbi:Hypothetical protein, putative, partial [Bodo saltans]